MNIDGYVKNRALTVRANQAIQSLNVTSDDGTISAFSPADALTLIAVTSGTDSPSKIAEDSRIQRTAVSAAVGKLEAASLIIVERHSITASLTPTKAGFKEVRAIKRKLADIKE